MMADTATRESRFLVLAPTGVDAVNIGRVLGRDHFGCRICRDVPDLCWQMHRGASAVVLAEEGLHAGDWAPLAQALTEQPPWSDLPIIVIASGATMAWWANGAEGRLGPRANLTLVERPLRGATLLAAARSTRRARRQQYQVRDLLAEREAFLRTLEQRVRERTDKLQEMVAELESFSYSVSHDLRAPLRIMAGYATAILEDHSAALAPEVREYIHRIADAAQRMDELTQDVLAYTQVSHAEIHLDSIDLDSLVTGLLDQYPNLSVARDSIAIAHPLLKVRAHAPSLAQALSNLLSNAVKFVRPGHDPRVAVATVRCGDDVRITVKDHGLGIPAAHKRKLFGLFERLAPKSVPGTGIGLAIVKRAVERMGGTVGVHSRFGKGSEFWIQLPRG